MMTREEAIEYLTPIATSAVLPRYKEALGMAIAALKEQGSKGVEIDQVKNEPLTIEELRGMDGEPVWVGDLQKWALVQVDETGRWEGIPFVSTPDFTWNVEVRKLRCYRRKFEEVKAT